MVEKQNKVPNWDKVDEALKNNVKILHEELGWFNEEELENTPIRIRKFYQEWKKNSEYDKFTTFDNGGKRGTKTKYDQLVVLNDITLHSMCSHHMLGFNGTANIAYLPGEKVIGVSKLSRIVKKVASRPQIQEGLTAEVAEELFNILKPRFLYVKMKAGHSCMSCRGVGEQNTKMVTTSVQYDKKDKMMVKNWITIKEEALRLFEEEN